MFWNLLRQKVNRAIHFLLFVIINEGQKNLNSSNWLLNLKNSASDGTIILSTMDKIIVPKIKILKFWAYWIPSKLKKILRLAAFSNKPFGNAKAKGFVWKECRKKILFGLNLVDDDTTKKGRRFQNMAFRPCFETSCDRKVNRAIHFLFFVIINEGPKNLNSSNWLLNLKNSANDGTIILSTMDKIIVPKIKILKFWAYWIPSKLKKNFKACGIFKQTFWPWMPRPKGLFERNAAEDSFGLNLVDDDTTKKRQEVSKHGLQAMFWNLLRQKVNRAIHFLLFFVIINEGPKRIWILQIDFSIWRIRPERRHNYFIHNG